MYDIVARVKRTVLAYIVLVGTPEGKERSGRKADEGGVGMCLAPLGLKTLHIGQTLVAT